MPTTKKLHFTCKNILTETHTATLLSVAVEEPNIAGILESIHDDDIKNWTRNHKSPDDLFEAKVVTKWINRNYKVEEVFSKESLEEWARNNGFTDFS